MPTSINAGLVEALVQARLQHRKISAERHICTGLEAAYQVQDQVITAYADVANTAFFGWKIALTGQGAQQKYQLSEPVYGQLLANMALPSAAKIAIKSDEALKLEIEFAFVLGTDLSPDHAYSDDALLEAITVVVPALEIVNIRWCSWDFSIEQFLADNAAASGFVLGTPVALNIRQINFNQLIKSSHHEVVVTVTEQDNAVKNYLWLMKTLLAKGQSINAGEMILTGSIIRPLNMELGSYRFDLLGQTLALDVVCAD